MPVLPILDLAIGLSFFYLLIALVCTTLNETIATWAKSRSKTLEKGVERLLGGDVRLKDAIYQHALIRNLAPADQRKPSYIPADKFALALMDVVTGPNKAASDPTALRDGLAGMAASNVNQALGAALQTQDPALVTDQQKIEAWFNDQMDRVSGWYKRTTQNRLFLLALVVTLVLNADSLKVIRVLWTNPAVTATLVEAAKDRLAKGRPDTEPQPIVEYENPNDATASKAINLPARDTVTDEEKKELGELTGWGNDWVTPWRKAHPGSGQMAWLGSVFYTHSLGWLITLLAISLGSPFWFDTLNRFMNIRGAGRAPHEPRDKSSKSGA
jgi:hypothetical protein